MKKFGGIQGDFLQLQQNSLSFTKILCYSNQNSFVILKKKVLWYSIKTLLH